MNAPVKITTATADPHPGLAFLAGCAARLELVEAGEMEIEDAVSGLIEHFEGLVGPIPCNCTCEIVADWGRRYPPVKQHDVRSRRTPESTIEAVMHSVRERGLPALKDPANVERMSRCDAVAKAPYHS